MTLPVYSDVEKEQGANQATNQDEYLIFSTLEELIEFTNQATNQAADQVVDLLNHTVHDRVRDMLGLLGNYKSRVELFRDLQLSNQTFNREKYLNPLIEHGWVSMEFPDKKTSPNQRYKLTASGEKLLRLIGEK